MIKRLFTIVGVEESSYFQVIVASKLIGWKRLRKLIGAKETAKQETKHETVNAFKNKVQIDSIELRENILSFGS